ncbi:putative deaminase [Raoultella ornithinolytica]|nr:putative deaminase [Raoultella ornithinolytica]
MNKDNSRREFLSQSGKMVTAAALFAAAAPVVYADERSISATTCDNQKVISPDDTHYYLDNVLLESGFEYENDVVVHTRTERQTLEIADGKIIALHNHRSHPDASLPRYDAGGKLMLPAMRDMHIHLDKNLLRRPVAFTQPPGGHHDSGHD